MLPNNIKAIINIALGDGWIGYRDGNRKFPYLICEHGEKQIEYCKQKQQYIESFGYKTYSRDYVNKNPNSKNFGHRFYRFSMQETEDLQTAHKHIYNSKKKFLDKSLLSYLDAESLAFYFMDNGSAKTVAYNQDDDYRWYYAERKVGKYILATNTFSTVEVENLSAWLEKTYGICSTVKQSSIYNRTGKESPELHINATKDKDLFRDLIYPHVAKFPSMLYKLSYVHTFNNIAFTRVPRENKNFTAEETERNDSSYHNEEDATVQAQ